MFVCQNWHILETKFYHLWLIMTCQLWFDSKISTRWILCSIEWLVCHICQLWLDSKIGTTCILEWLVCHICQLWYKVQCIPMLVECDIPLLDLKCFLPTMVHSDKPSLDWHLFYQLWYILTSQVWIDVFSTNYGIFRQAKLDEMALNQCW